MLLLIAGVLGSVVAGLVADRYGGAALQQAIFSQLTIVRENKREEIVAYLARLRTESQLLSELPITIKAFKAFSAAYRDAVKDAPPAAPPPGFHPAASDLAEPARAGANTPTAEPASPELVAFYRDKFLPGLARESEGVPTLEAYLPRQTVARRLQTDYLAKNPNPEGERWKLMAGASGAPYDRVHAEYHPFLAEAFRRIGMQDILLVGLDGKVVYELAKKTDFATDLRTGIYSHTGAARAFEAAIAQRDLGAIAFESFSAYPPNNLAATAFLAAPLIEGGAVIGAILVEISTDEIENKMSSNRGWSRIGLGRTGSAYLVGADLKARSNDRFLYEDKPGFLKALAAAGVDGETIARIDRTNSMVLNLTIDTEASKAALRGETGAAVIRDYRNLPVLSAWAPLSAPGVSWALIAEMDVSEAFAPQNAFRQALLIAVALMTMALTMLSFLGTEAFVRPIRAIMAGVKALGAGDDRARIPVKGDDEFARLAEGFNSMADEIEARNSAIREKTAEYEKLLKNVYPDVIAERVKLGQTSISERIQNVSVAALTIDGMETLFRDETLDTVEAANLIVDAFDNAALRHGVEKIKTLGERYYAACGLSAPRLDHAARSVAFVEDCCRALAGLSKNWGLSLSLRAGVASGDVEAGLIGRQRTVYDLWGFPRLAADRIVFEAAENAIRITEATWDALGRPARFEPRPPIRTTSLGDIATLEMPALRPVASRPADEKELTHE
jgi:class 3 adenylate cyclase